MIIPESVTAFLKEVQNISIGFNSITFLAPDELVAAQAAYRVNAQGVSLVTGKEGDWEAGWLVIAKDRLGDPVFIDCNEEDTNVMTAAEGDDEWDPIFIADSIPHFRQIIDQLLVLGEGRTTVAALKQHPIPEKERQAVIRDITKQNPDSDVWYWEDFLEN